MHTHGTNMVDHRSALCGPLKLYAAEHSLDRAMSWLVASMLAPHDSPLTSAADTACSAFFLPAAQCMTSDAYRQKSLYT